MRRTYWGPMEMPVFTKVFNREAVIFEGAATLSYNYNPDYGDDKVCQCGHRYYRHFDTYEDMKPVGCKYCSCDLFQPQT